MTRLTPSRRSLLAAAGGRGLSVSFMGRAAFADDAVGRRKFVTVVARGGMDGLSVSPPVGDPDYEGLRGRIAIPAGAALKLDSTFALHPALAGVHALALKGQARIAPAIASPDRARSHFEAQDVLESGGAMVYAASSGFLNRALTAAGGRRIEALSVGATAPLILRGPVQTASWSPGPSGEGSPRLPAILADLYAGDPLLAPALASGLQTVAMAPTAQEGVGDMSAPVDAADDGVAGFVRRGQNTARTLGKTVAGFMTQAGGPQIVAISVDGWDTHANQGAAEGQLATRLLYLDALLMGLNEGLGAAWNDTVVVVATEFGRTARINGTGGTDHGTGSTAIVLGGALKPGGIIGDWPTLRAEALFEGRDTRPTLDMRGLFKGVLADHLGLDRAALEGTVFPDSGAAAAVRGMV
ncbi:MAG: DUF1501 domain-containing protein [Caulobacterales bacterium]|nr:DUF1501 domain-containing protein [Caulobacterales bacterium]